MISQLWSFTPPPHPSPSPAFGTHRCCRQEQGWNKLHMATNDDNRPKALNDSRNSVVETECTSKMLVIYWGWAFDRKDIGVATNKAAKEAERSFDPQKISQKWKKWTSEPNVCTFNTDRALYIPFQNISECAWSYAHFAQTQIPLCSIFASEMPLIAFWDKILFCRLA